MYQLRPYQQEAVDRTLNYFRKLRHPAVIVLPTGAGKSLVIAELAKIAKGRVLVLAHVKELVEQNHLKYESYGLHAGIYSAGLNQKDSKQKVIFGSIQSVAKAKDTFFKDFTLLVIDECHRVGMEPETQYAKVIEQLKRNNPRICILGLTATPYRLGVGWIYNCALRGEIKTQDPRFFKHCIYDLPLEYMIRNRYLTPPVKVDIPVTSYDFSELTEGGQTYTMAQVEEVLNQQRRLTPLIIKNIIDITDSDQRQGVMVFSSTVKHAQEIMQHLPEGQARLVVGTTELSERDQIVDDFKQKAFKYLVNVSVLTTGFDAAHVDVIAILRPTESISLYQQIIGRGLRLDTDKKDCLVLDYTGMGHSIFSPEIGDKKADSESVAVQVPCPECGFVNDFWGILDDDGSLLEHYGRKCRGGQTNPQTLVFTPCGYRFRFKICNQCGTENDITARDCHRCGSVMIDPDEKLKQARLSKDAHVLTPDSFELLERMDKNGNAYLQVKYYDYDANALTEMHYLNNSTSLKKFAINFMRSHLRTPELKVQIRSVSDVLSIQSQLRMPAFIIARQQGKFWKITEKIFSEEL
ncbi:MULTISPECIES: DEAD/DEAH box helicase [unclassified Lentimonas]|uniref:DEAD/DEAH box helicase n=1 Tax=unclassified Lentimonas TaxID=2630993 RepID=UPI0013284662|nr:MULTISPECIES: DEAD/DEAH box helicase family protein [unclassified Lentimonas]CAA6679773.1 ATP-dependent RNA helicase YejH [Lentimonas sp. CC4]CAA6685716.1 ATP-dependent RNA helicase YejH [Lentimonas sp. CC6]CAA7077159.1 ATP-dependent RNA helicase YejH [Lentimonas sp. CC4]CAA7168757.1 ATP-dependent RNA helicase YejH [Lentimonas sp. CC21]CAA7180875.1 ATP-dependent RNA helicase YejH [Lentimonas sp. CC8]